jgi:hypothetical protein
LRKESPALINGGLRWVAVEKDYLAYLRESKDQSLLIFIARSAVNAEIDLSKYAIKEEDLYEQEEVVAENGEDDIQEIDLDEIKSEISRMTNEILSKHFK